MKDRESVSVNLQTMMLYACQEKRITQKEFEIMQGQLFDLLIEVVMKNGQDPIELGAEQTEQIIASISYQIEAGLWNEGSLENKVNKLKETHLKELYEKGHQALMMCLCECKEMSDHLIAYSLPIDLEAYLDTIKKGVPEFLEQYDLDRKANELPGFFDYPLCVEPTHTTGVLYAHAYLEHLQCEEEFLSAFEEGRFGDLLLGYSANYKQLSINLYELVLNNVIGNLLLQKPSSTLQTLHMDEEGRKELAMIAQRMGHMELTEKVTKVVSDYLRECGHAWSTECNSYVMKSLSKFIYRYQQTARNNTLEQFFVSQKQNKGISNNHYENPERMSSVSRNDLRKELESCRYSQDKISMIRKKVTNLEDLIEVLSQSVYGEEAKEFFAGLGDYELAALMVKVLHDSENSDCFHEMESANWQLELLLTINQMEPERQQIINQLVRKMRK